MSWLDHHRRSEGHAASAELALRAGDEAQAKTLYAMAAAEEALGLEELDRSKARTLGVSAVSAVSLYFKAREYLDAERCAVQWLAEPAMPEFAREQTRSLLQSIWSEQVRERAGVNFVPGQVMVSVKGGQVVEGGAPLDLIVEKVQIVQNLFYRTAEYIRDLPYRKRGPASAEIRGSCRPWLFQTAPGSYQFAVAVQEWQQQELFSEPAPSSREVAKRFLEILKAGVDDPEEGLRREVPDQDYRRTFLALTRNLAPRGKTFESLEIRSSDQSTPLHLDTETRKQVGSALRASRAQIIETDSERESLTGVLRAVHLDRDWLEVTVADEHIKVTGVGEAVDDIIGPMVNKPVVVLVDKDALGKRVFVDIEPDD